MGRYIHHKTHTVAQTSVDFAATLPMTTKLALIPYLRTLVTAERAQRLCEVLQNRTRHITIVLEDLFQTQNISAVMRTCECYGVQDVHVIEKENDFVIHDAISMGSNKWLTLHNYPNEQGNVAKCAARLHEQGYKLVATLPAEDSRFIDDFPIEEKTAFLFGTELTGLSPEAIAACDAAVKIPMYGFTESFNISNSVAILTANRIERLHQSAINWHLTDEEHAELYFEWLCKSIRNAEFIIKRRLQELDGNSLNH